MGNQKHQKSSCRAYGLIFVKIRAKYGHFLGKNTGIIPAKFRFWWFSRLFAIYCTFSENCVMLRATALVILSSFQSRFTPPTRGSTSQYFLQIFCQNSAYFWEFLPKILRKILPKKRVITTFATKKRVNAIFATKRMRNCSINRFMTQIFASVKGKAWFFD